MPVACDLTPKQEAKELNEVEHLEKEVKRLREHLLNLNEQFEKDLQTLSEENRIIKEEISERDLRILELTHEVEKTRKDSDCQAEKESILRAMELLEISKIHLIIRF